MTLVFFFIILKITNNHQIYALIKDTEKDNYSYIKYPLQKGIRN